MIRVLLADNDAISKSKIRSFLGTDTDINIVGDCADGMEAKEKIDTLEPDVVILDIDLPKLSGFEILESTKRARSPYVIITSAQDKYALRAFEFSVIDYLVKPLDKYRFQDGVTRAKRYLERDARAEGRAAPANAPLAEPAGGQAQALSDRIPIKRGRRFKLINASAIRHIMADGNYTNLHMLTGEVIRTSERISQLENKLVGKRFQRIRRSVIINLEHLREIRSTHGQYEFIMNNGESFLSGGLYKRELSALFGSSGARQHTG